MTGVVLSTILVTGLVVSASPATADPASAAATCLANTRLNQFTATGSPYGNGTTLSWDVTRGCPEVTVITSDIPLPQPTTNTSLKAPSVTTEYNLYAKIGGLPARLLGTRTALAGKIIDYVYIAKARAWMGTPGDGPDADAAKVIAHKMAGAFTEQAKRIFLGKRIDIHIIPHDAKLTDLPPWRSKAGTTTCTDEDPEGEEGCVNDRPWDDVRGASSGAVAVGEENLVYIEGKSTYHHGHTLAHEFGHMPVNFNETLRNSVQTILNDRGPEASYVGQDVNTRQNADEYFAESTAGLFRYPISATSLTEEYNPTWLADHDVPLLKKLKTIYNVLACNSNGFCYL
ncbi:hypothetical protein [Acrocarpospora corrugata]|uniref:hypothetical protein n=1 Tax=Acrocarpospora corrugata TaxID=35763 RepID=UPI0012D35CF5|nr:hypothetical protein [Acrocarpospora corrugata]